MKGAKIGREDCRRARFRRGRAWQSDRHSDRPWKLAIGGFRRDTGDPLLVGTPPASRRLRVPVPG